MNIRRFIRSSCAGVVTSVHINLPYWYVCIVVAVKYALWNLVR